MRTEECESIFWEDQYITERDGGYVVWDERDEFLYWCDTLTGARLYVIEHCMNYRRTKNHGTR